MELIKKICRSYADIVFPVTCVCCGTSTNSEDRFICSLCRNRKFENAGNAQNDILPEFVRFVHTMWYFDKGGYLQNLLHQLKYQYLKGVGLELGYLLGKHFSEGISKNYPDEISRMDPVIVPVPLHPSKQRRRGYNQAGALAEGVANFTGWDIIGESIVTRVKKTKTQTGLNSEQRAENLKSAFQIKRPEELKNRFTILVDDVFTTGATTFELAGTISEVNGQNSGILTVARA